MNLICKGDKMIFQSGLISALFSAQGGNIARSNRSSTSNQIECRHANLLCMHHISNWLATSGNGIPKTAVIPMPHKTVSGEIWPYHQDHKKIHSSYNPLKKHVSFPHVFLRPFSCGPHFLCSSRCWCLNRSSANQGPVILVFKN